jgi:hypothetical protein
MTFLDCGGVDDRQDEVPALAHDLFLNALLALVGQHVPGRQRLAIVGDEDQVLALGHVDEEGVPEHPHQEEADEQDNGPDHQGLGIAATSVRPEAEIHVGRAVVTRIMRSGHWCTLR